MEKQLTIKEASQQTGVSTDTLRYYERIGLITDVKRAQNGHRRYDSNDITWILFLKQLRATGMTISDMKHFAQLKRGGTVTVTLRREMLEQYRQNLEAQVQSIMDFMSIIDAKIARHKLHEQTINEEIDHDRKQSKMA